jgi:NAD(P)-dependent dehydrogenase (short-subunit alcohol dehydrogenase family)
MARWTESNIEDLTGRIAIVTGANTGIGYETARALAAKGAQVTLACRSPDKGEDAVRRLKDLVPEARLEFRALDLSDLESVQRFAEGFAEDHDRLDLLINNAGVMMPPYGKTKQGFELQFGVNHLGHFALTLRLLQRLSKTPGSRVVTVSSQAHRQGVIDFDDLSWERKKYKPMPSYGQSKLANLLFMFELERKLKAAGLDVTAAAAHPGWTGTDLQRHVGLFQALNHLFAMPRPQGALPTLRAATAPDVKGGDYFGPHGIYEMRGYPKKVGSTDAARSLEDAARLWEVSESLTGVSFEAPAA